MDLGAMDLILQPEETTECRNCLIYQKKMDNWMQWKKFYHEKLENQDKLLHIVASYERDKQHLMELQLAYDQRTRDASHAREQIASLLLELKPLREKVTSLEKMLEDEKKSHQTKDDEICSLSFISSQLDHENKMLKSKMNLNLIDVLERKLNSARKNVKYLKCQLDEKNCHISELKESRLALHENHLRIRKKAAWSFRLAWAYGSELIKLGKNPDDVTDEASWSVLLSQLELIHNQLESHYAVYRSKKEEQLKEAMVPTAIIPSQEQWLNDFEEDGLGEELDLDREEIKVETNEGDDDGKKLENLIQCIDVIDNGQEILGSKQAVHNDPVVLSSPVKEEPQIIGYENAGSTETKQSNSGKTEHAGNAETKQSDSLKNESKTCKRGRPKKKKSTDCYNNLTLGGEKENVGMVKDSDINHKVKVASGENVPSVIRHQRKEKGHSNDIVKDICNSGNLLNVGEKTVMSGSVGNETKSTDLGDFPSKVKDYSSDHDYIMSLLNEMKPPNKMSPLSDIDSLQKAANEGYQGMSSVMEDLGLLSESSDEEVEISPKRIMKQESEEFIVDSDVQNFHSSEKFSFNIDELCSELGRINSEKINEQSDSSKVNETFVPKMSDMSGVDSVTTAENKMRETDVQNTSAVNMKSNRKEMNSSSNCIPKTLSEMCLSEDSDHDDVLSLKGSETKISYSIEKNCTSFPQQYNNKEKEMQDSLQDFEQTEEQEDSRKISHENTACLTINAEEKSKSVNIENMSQNGIWKNTLEEPKGSEVGMEVSVFKNLKREPSVDDQVQERMSMTSEYIFIKKEESFPDNCPTQHFIPLYPRKEESLHSVINTSQTNSTRSAQTCPAQRKSTRGEMLAHSLFSSESEDAEDFTWKENDLSVHEDRKNNLSYAQVNDKENIGTDDVHSAIESKGKFTITENEQNVQYNSNDAKVTRNFGVKPCEKTQPMHTTINEIENGKDARILQAGNESSVTISIGIKEENHITKDTINSETDFQCNELEKSTSYIESKHGEKTEKQSLSCCLEVKPIVNGENERICDKFENFIPNDCYDPPLSPIDCLEDDEITDTDIDILNPVSPPETKVQEVHSKNKLSKNGHTKQIDSPALRSNIASMKIIDVEGGADSQKQTHSGNVIVDETGTYHKKLNVSKDPVLPSIDASSQVNNTRKNKPTKQNLSPGINEAVILYSSESENEGTVHIENTKLFFVHRQDSTGFIPVDVNHRKEKGIVEVGQKQDVKQDDIDLRNVDNRHREENHQVNNESAGFCDSVVENNVDSNKETSDSEPCSKTPASNRVKHVEGEVVNNSPKGKSANIYLKDSLIVKTNSEQSNLHSSNVNASLTANVLETRTRDSAVRDINLSQHISNIDERDNLIQKPSSPISQNQVKESVTLCSPLDMGNKVLTTKLNETGSSDSNSLNTNNIVNVNEQTSEKSLSRSTDNTPLLSKDKYENGNITITHSGLEHTLPLTDCVVDQSFTNGSIVTSNTNLGEHNLDSSPIVASSLTAINIESKVLENKGKNNLSAADGCEQQSIKKANLEKTIKKGAAVGCKQRSIKKVNMDKTRNVKDMKKETECRVTEMEEKQDKCIEKMESSPPSSNLADNCRNWKQKDDFTKIGLEKVIVEEENRDNKSESEDNDSNLDEKEKRSTKAIIAISELETPRVQFSWGRLQSLPKKKTDSKTKFLMLKKIKHENPDAYSTVKPNVFTLELRNYRKKVNDVIEELKYTSSNNDEKELLVKQPEDSLLKKTNEALCKTFGKKSDKGNFSNGKEARKRKEKKSLVCVSKRRKIAQNLFSSASSDEEEPTLYVRRRGFIKRKNLRSDHDNGTEESESVNDVHRKSRPRRSLRSQVVSSDSTTPDSSSSRITAMSQRKERQKRTTSTSSYGSLRTSVSESGVQSPPKHIHEETQQTEDTFSSDVSEDEISFKRKQNMQIVVNSESEYSDCNDKEINLQKKRRLAEIERRRPKKNEPLRSTFLENRIQPQFYGKNKCNTLAHHSKNESLALKMASLRRSNKKSQEDIAIHRNVKECKKSDDKKSKTFSAEKKNKLPANPGQAAEIASKLRRHYAELKEKERSVILLDSSPPVVPKNRSKREQEVDVMPHSLGKRKCLPYKSSEFCTTTSDEEEVKIKMPNREQTLESSTPVSSTIRSNISELDEFCPSTTDGELVIEECQESFTVSTGSATNEMEADMTISSTSCKSEEICSSVLKNEGDMDESCKPVTTTLACDSSSARIGHPGLVSGLAKLGTLHKRKAPPKQVAPIPANIPTNLPVSAETIERLFNRFLTSKQSSTKTYYESVGCSKEYVGDIKPTKEMPQAHSEYAPPFDNDNVGNNIPTMYRSIDSLQDNAARTALSSLNKEKPLLETTNNGFHSKETVISERNTILSSEPSCVVYTNELQNQNCDVDSTMKCESRNRIMEQESNPPYADADFLHDEEKENELCEILDDLTTCKYMGKEWKRLLYMLKVSAASVPVTQIAKAFVWCILCQNPLEEKKVTQGLTPTLYQLFQAMCVLELRLGLQQDSLRTSVSSAIHNLVCQPSPDLRPHSLGCLAAWYVANLSYGENNDKEVHQKGRAFLVDLIWYHPGTVHLALHMALTSGQKFLIRMISTREPSGIEKVLQWVAFHGPWMGAECIRNRLTTYLTKQIGVQKPPDSNPNVLLRKFLTMLADTTDEAVACNLMTSILLLVCWQGQPWIQNQLLPIANSIITKQTERELAQDCIPKVLLNILANQIGNLQRYFRINSRAANDKLDCDMEKLRTTIAQLLNLAWEKSTDE